MTKTAAQQLLSDPDNHYPYKRDEALAAGIPTELVDAAAAVVEAQEAYLRDPSEENLQVRNDAEHAAQQVAAERRRGLSQLGEAADDAVRPATVEGKASR